MVDFSQAVHSPHFNVGAQESQSIFFEYLFIDEAYFHSFIAMTAAFFDFVTGQQTSAASNVNHLGRALSLINDKLSSRDALSDTILASVIVLCSLENMRGDARKMTVHFEGLCRMIELRGGVAALEKNPPLLEKIRGYVSALNDVG
ncbi:hypothetical protein FZEAL_10004 [Fusarium zealandicum]|uniref:Uncharacterized protein n=1 Tax=Fusarium zealandicum TaxID=1053134 RepID=A0A8H4U6T1_9HYPO|nr:hypothetical protein FZEAL_10004 [Fusarium zealandicum]